MYFLRGPFFRNRGPLGDPFSLKRDPFQKLHKKSRKQGYGPPFFVPLVRSTVGTRESKCVLVAFYKELPCLNIDFCL